MTLSSINPDFKRLIYLGQVGWDGKDEFISIWDITNNKEVKRINIPYMDVDSGEIQWDKTGDNFIVHSIPIEKPFDKNNIGMDFYLISRNGDIRQISHISNQYAGFQIPYQLSPDGTKVAFWMKTEKTPVTQLTFSVKLAILDIQTGNVIDLCIDDKYDHGNSVFSPVWSPDGQYLAISQLDTSSGKQVSKILIIDLKNSMYLTINENEMMLVRGWLTQN
jgi:WD40 repeat protein